MLDNAMLDLNSKKMVTAVGRPWLTSVRVLRPVSGGRVKGLGLTSPFIFA